ADPDHQLQPREHPRSGLQRPDGREGRNHRRRGRHLSSAPASGLASANGKLRRTRHMVGTQRRALVAVAAVVTILAACTSQGASSPPAAPSQGQPTSGPSGSAGAEPSQAVAAGTCDLKSLPPAADGSEQDEAARVKVDQSAFRNDPPWKLGVSAGYLSNSWVQFDFANLRYAVSKDDRFDPDILFLDANFDVNKQVSDIQDLVNAGVDGIIY